MSKYVCYPPKVIVTDCFSQDFFNLPTKQTKLQKSGVFLHKERMIPNSFKDVCIVYGMGRNFDG